MERIFIYCTKCNDLLEAEYCKGNWYCENCHALVNKEVKAEKERNLKNAKK